MQLNEIFKSDYYLPNQFDLDQSAMNPNEYTSTVTEFFITNPGKNNIEVKFTKDSTYYEIGLFDKKRMIGNFSLKLKPLPGLPVIYEIYETALLKSYQGLGIGLAAYYGLITHGNMPFYSTGSHSPGSVKTWARLAKNPKINAYWYDSRKGHPTYKPAMLSPSKNEITKTNNNSLYLSAEEYRKQADSENDYNAKYYYGIILTAKNSQVDKRILNLINKIKVDSIKPHSKKDSLGNIIK